MFMNLTLSIKGSCQEMCSLATEKWWYSSRSICIKNKKLQVHILCLQQTTWRHQEVANSYSFSKDSLFRGTCGTVSWQVRATIFPIWSSLDCFFQAQYSAKNHHKGSHHMRKTVKKTDNICTGRRGVYPSSFILAWFYQALKSLGNGLCTLRNLHKMSFVCIIANRVA